MEWYARRGDERLGPLDDDALRAGASDGTIGRDTLVWHAGMSEWTPVASIPGILTPPELAATPAAGGSAGAGVLPTEIGPLAAPWPRYWARMLDLSLEVALLAMVVGVIAPSLFDFSGDARASMKLRLLSFALAPFAMIVDALIYALFGNTAGKAVAGLRVRDVGGEKLPFATYFWRNLQVYWIGLGMALPLVSWITLMRSYKRAKDGLTLWDKSLDTRVSTTAKGSFRPALAALAYLAVLFGDAAVARHDQAQAKPRDKVARAEASPEAQLAQAAAAVRKIAPVKLDDETRLDGAEAGPGLRFAYDYTLLNADTSELDAEAIARYFAGTLRDELVQQVCDGSDLSEMHDLGVTIVFRYRDNKGTPMGSVAIGKDDCKGLTAVADAD